MWFLHQIVTCSKKASTILTSLNDSASFNLGNLSLCIVIFIFLRKKNYNIYISILKKKKKKPTNVWVQIQWLLVSHLLHRLTLSLSLSLSDLLQSLICHDLFFEVPELHWSWTRPEYPICFFFFFFRKWVLLQNHQTLLLLYLE